MAHDCPSLELVVLHSKRPDNVAEENEDPTITNESHGLCDAQPETMEQQPNDRHNSQAELVSVPKRLHLGYFSTINLCLNKIVGTGIFVSPSVVLKATESKGISLTLWLIGCLVTWGGLYIYLEYGFRWPLTGGELYYVDKVYTKPYRLLTYIFATMVVLVGGVQANALTFGREIILAGADATTPVNTNLQKLFAVLIVTFVCQLQAYSRTIYIRVSNVLAIFKISSLVFISICGLIALGGIRRHSIALIDTSYGTENLTHVFNTRAESPYAYSLALLNVMRAFLGYENANLVLEEVRRPDDDPRRIFRRAITISVIIVCFLYMTTNVAFFTACTTEEMLNSPETLALFLEKVFGKSKHAHTASSIVLALSAAGAIMSLTFAYVRVKQEIGRIGILPIPEFWSKTSHRRTPAHALLLHWIFSVICIAVTPLNEPQGFLVMSTFYSYIHTWISILLGCGLLCAPWLSCFNGEDGQPWKSESSRFGYRLLVPLTVTYVCANAFVLVFSFFPPKTKAVPSTKGQIITALAGPIAGHSIIAFGVIWWAWDRRILPRLGYHFKVSAGEISYSEAWKADTLKVTFSRSLEGIASRFYKAWRPVFTWFWSFLQGKSE